MPKDTPILDPKKQIKKAERRKNEVWFETRWKQIDGQPYESEFRFHPRRKWRFDFAFPGCVPKIAVEIDPAAHKLYWNSYLRDVEKMNEALFLGWQVFRITGHMIRADDVYFLEKLKVYINENTKLLSKDSI